MKAIKIICSIYRDRIISWQCCVCQKVGPREAMVELNDGSGRTAHRWPCRELVTP